MENPKSVRQTCKSFFEQASTHGLSNILRNDSTIAKTVWVIILASAMVCAVSSINSALTAFLNREFLTAFKLINDNRSPFPAVTVCNMNAYRKSVLEKTLNSSQNEEEGEEFDRNWALRLITAKWLYVLGEKLNLKNGKFIESIIPTVGFLNISVATLTGHQEEDLIWKCSLDGIDCKDKGFFTQTYNPTYGNCYTFNFDSNIEIKVDSKIRNKILIANPATRI
jgi:hypothetical protein